MRSGSKTLKKQGAKCKYLIDTSALFPLLLSDRAVSLDKFSVTSLTEYEVGNVLWKEARNRRIDVKAATQIFSSALLELKRTSAFSIEDVLSIALERKLTFYDASYAYIAEKEGLTLVTEDTELLKKCKFAIKTKDVDD